MTKIVSDLKSQILKYLKKYLKTNYKNRLTFNEIQLLTWNDLNFWMISPFRIQKENQKTNWLSSSIKMTLNTDKALVQFFFIKSRFKY